jgi:hypothetical protein
MRVVCLFCAMIGFISAPPVLAQEASVERGLYVSIVGGCHDCHTQGYNESGGKIDPAKALMGSTVGFRGPWGTTYPANLRIRVSQLPEANYLTKMKNIRTLPPMPWYNVQAMNETDVRSLYLYIKSLGDPGQPAPLALPPDEEPTTPFIQLAPPQMPKS